jgi:flagellar hook protein FlgE
MSITRTLNTGASGLRSHSEAIGVVGDNIANVNTVGFKKQRAGFEDVLGRAVAGSANMAPTAGAGSKLAHIEQMWSQGALLTTDSPTDLAIAGNGFFVVEGMANGQQGRYFTRAGQFSLDQSGNLVNPHGLNLVGYTADANGTMGTTPGALNVSGSSVPARSTSTVDMAVQLDSNAAVPAAWDPADPAGTSNFSTSVTVYDSLGNSHEVTAYFRKSADNSWEWHAMVDGGELNGGTAGTPQEIGTGTLTFTSSGALDTETPGATSIDFTGGAAAGQAIAFDFGESITGDGGTGMGATTQFASESATTGLAQDGYAAGSVASIGIDSDGTITGAFTNGQRRVLGQVALASFAAQDGLERTGQGLWTATNTSGEALIGAAESGGRGSIVSGALEQSNVDIGTEFVNLIAYQRGFQANSRIITTADEIYSELVSLKR